MVAYYGECVGDVSLKMNCGWFNEPILTLHWGLTLHTWKLVEGQHYDNLFIYCIFIEILRLKNEWKNVFCVIVFCKNTDNFSHILGLSDWFRD